MTKIQQQADDSDYMAKRFSDCEWVCTWRGGAGTDDCSPAVAARAASREPGWGSATATTMAPGRAAKLYKCSRPIMPTPMMPYFRILPGSILASFPTASVPLSSSSGYVHMAERSAGLCLSCAGYSGPIQQSTFLARQELGKWWSAKAIQIPARSSTVRHLVSERNRFITPHLTEHREFRKKHMECRCT